MIKLFGRNKQSVSPLKKETANPSVPLLDPDEAFRPSTPLTHRLPDFFFVLAILFGLMLILLEPPFVCPDENTHFLNICRISRGDFFPTVVDGQIGCYLTEEELNYFQSYGGIYNGMSDLLPYDYSTFRQLIDRQPSGELVFYATTSIQINPMSYLLPALSVAVFKALTRGLSSYLIVSLAKITNLFFYAIVIRWALKKTPVFRNSMFLFALMPMSLFQGASTSYDAFLIPTSFLLFAYATKILCAPEDYKISREDIFAICFACAFLFGAKIAYAPLVLILLAICHKKFGGWKQWGICVGLVGAVGVVFFLIPSLINGAITKEFAPPLTEVQIAHKAYVAENLHRFPIVIQKTFKTFGTFWLSSFIGVLGWLDTSFPKPFLILFVLAFGFNALLDMCHTKGISRRARFLSLASVLIFFLGTIWTMYTVWNPVLTNTAGGDIAYGGQGRYFIPVVLFVLISFSNNLLERLPFGTKLEKFRYSMVRVTGVASASLTVLLILVRYWAA